MVKVSTLGLAIMVVGVATTLSRYPNTAYLVFCTRNLDVGFW